MSAADVDTQMLNKYLPNKYVERGENEKGVFGRFLQKEKRKKEKSEPFSLRAW